MSRNSDKLVREKKEQLQQGAPQSAPNPGQIFGLNFVTPVETVKLPSAGKFYPKTSPLFGVESVKIRHMTSKEEDLLSTASNREDSFEVYDLLIDSLLVDKNLNSSVFSEEDKMAVILNSRITGYGPEYKTSLYCQSCKKPTKHVFDLSKNCIKPAKIESEYLPNEDLFECVLPKSKISVKILSSSDKISEELSIEKKQKEKYNLPFNQTVSFISKAIVSANGISDKNQITKLAEILPAIDAKYIKEFFVSSRPSISTSQLVKCQECLTETEQEAPITWAFFRTDF